jgi:hypothetical protein
LFLRRLQRLLVRRAQLLGAARDHLVDLARLDQLGLLVAAKLLDEVLDLVEVAEPLHLVLQLLQHARRLAPGLGRRALLLQGGLQAGDVVLAPVHVQDVLAVLLLVVRLRLLRQLRPRVLVQRAREPER